MYWCSLSDSMNSERARFVWESHYGKLSKILWEIILISMIDHRNFRYHATTSVDCFVRKQTRKQSLPENAAVSRHLAVLIYQPTELNSMYSNEATLPKQFHCITMQSSVRWSGQFLRTILAEILESHSENFERQSDLSQTSLNRFECLNHIILSSAKSSFLENAHVDYDDHSIFGRLKKYQFVREKMAIITFWNESTDFSKKRNIE